MHNTNGKCLIGKKVKVVTTPKYNPMNILQPTYRYGTITEVNTEKDRDNIIKEPFRVEYINDSGVVESYWYSGWSLMVLSI